MSCSEYDTPSVNLEDTASSRVFSNSTVYTNQEMLVANPNSSFTVWFGVDDHLMKYIHAIKKRQHVMLLVLESKNDWKKIGMVLDKMKLHYPIVLKYQSEKRDTIRSTSQVALLLTSQNYSLNFQECSWFHPELGYPTNVWDLTPNNSFEVANPQYKNYSVNEGIEEIPFGYASFDVFLMLHQLSKPLPVLRWTYVGPRNGSVVRYSNNIMPCNICFV